jgi:hypothetical protein
MEKRVPGVCTARIIPAETNQRFSCCSHHYPSSLSGHVHLKIIDTNYGVNSLVLLCRESCLVLPRKFEQSVKYRSGQCLHRIRLLRPCERWNTALFVIICGPNLVLFSTSGGHVRGSDDCQCAQLPSDFTNNSNYQMRYTCRVLRHNNDDAISFVHLERFLPQILLRVLPHNVYNSDIRNHTPMLLDFIPERAEDEKIMITPGIHK